MTESSQPLRYFIRAAGDPAPWFRQRSLTNPSYAFDSAAGRNLVLCFFGSSRHPSAIAALKAVERNRALFDDVHASFFGVSIDPNDAEPGVLAESYPGVRHFLDFDGKVSIEYGSLPSGAPLKAGTPFISRWVIIDPTMRIITTIRFDEAGEDHQAVMDRIKALPPAGRHAGFEVPTPILIIPNVFDPAFCRQLIDLYQADGGEETGFMVERDGKTVGVLDHGHKRRRDFTIEDPEIIKLTQKWVQRRINPEIEKVHQFTPTRMERYLVGCYSAEDGGHFRPHRDNTTRGTAHRRFAVSINLNDGFEGGEVGFPEYGPRTFKAPAGGAVIFSCALLHTVTKVTKGRRYAFLPFLYDDAAAKIREQNNAYLDDKIEAYDPNKKNAA